MSRHFPLLMTLLLALLLCGAGSAMTLAGVARYQAEAFLRDWEDKAAEPDGRAWSVAEAAAQNALAWYPVANGDYLDRLGRVYSWQFYQHPYGSAAVLGSVFPAEQAAAIDVSRRRALAAYRAAVAVRPEAPASWVRLAHAKRYLLQFDAEFGMAYARAARLGPWQPETGLELAAIGFGAWSSLSNDQRELAMRQGLRAAEGGSIAARTLGRMAAEAGLAAQLCGRATLQQLLLLKVCR